MKGNIKLLRTALVMSLLFCMQYTYATAMPQQNAFWGIAVGDAGGQGVAVTAVRDKSPGGVCLQAGDILLSINGMAVHSPQEFSVMKNSFPLYTPLNLAVKRNGAIIQCQITLEGTAPLEVKSVKSEFVIPGVPPPPTTAPSAIEALDQINVLDQVILDPNSGQIAIIGHYDARYNTGPIPYMDMLKTAMVYPRPRFNLETSKETKQMMADRAGIITMWEWDAKDFILGHPELEQERQVMIQAWASACGLSPREFVTLYNYVYFGAKEVSPPPEIRALQSKILTNLGFADAAQAYGLVNEAGAVSAIKALQVLGQAAEGRAILARSGGEAGKAQGTLTAAVYLAIMEKIYASAGLVDLLRDDLAQGRITWQEVVKQAQGKLLPIRSSSDKREIAKAALNKIQLSEKGTKVLSKVSLTGQVNLEPLDVDANSQLARILYEADFSYKSVKVLPQLFWNIPGSMSEQEYEISKGFYNTQNKPRSTDFWLEPKSVAMTVSPDRRVVTFGLAQMSCMSRTYFAKQEDANSLGDISHSYDDFCAGVMNNYDQYARILPAFHKVRETAKIIALANWLIAEKVPVDMSGIAQDKWDSPKTVSGFWRACFVYYDEKGDGSYATYSSAGAGYSGGVTFNRSNWTEMKPDTVGETKVTDQLALSAGLGQKAVQAAQSGNLENARYLAELSAQAMNGSLAKSVLAKLNIVVPEAKVAVPIAPANVQLQKEMIKKTHQQIAVLSRSPAAGTATATLNQISSLYDKLRDNPASASDYLLRLQTGQLSSPTAIQTATTKPAAMTVCGETSLGSELLPADRKEYLTKKLGEARDRLKYINEALLKLIAINAAERAESEKLTADISAQYSEAKNRAWDVVFDLLTSVSLDAFGAEQAKRLKGIDDAISGKIALKTTSLDAAALKKIEDEIKLLQSAKFRSEEAYASIKREIDLFKGVSYGKDIDDWQNKNQDSNKQAQSGLALVGKLALEHPELEKWLGRKAFFAGEKLWQVATMGKMAYYAWGFYLDILTQQTIWEPMANKLQNNLNFNMQAMEHLRQSAAQTSQEIHCMERLLH